MHLTERERDKLLIFTAAELARQRRSRGLKLNYPEAVALISAEVLEGIRDGRSVQDLMGWGATLLSAEDVLDGVPEMLHDIWTKRIEMVEHCLNHFSANTLSFAGVTGRRLSLEALTPLSRRCCSPSQLCVHK